MESGSVKRLGKSVLSWVISNLAAWLLIYTVTPVISALMAHKPIQISFALDGMFWLMIFATLIPTGVVGLPVQTLLQRIGMTDFWSNLLAATFIGFPIGILWVNSLYAGIDDDPDAPQKSAFVQISESISEFGHDDSWARLVITFLLFGATIFWLIRRPDLDNKLPSAKPVTPTTTP